LELNFEPWEEEFTMDIIGRSKYRLMVMFSNFLDEKIRNFEFYENKYLLQRKLEDCVDAFLLQSHDKDAPFLDDNMLLELLNSSETSEFQNQSFLLNQEDSSSENPDALE